MKWFKNFIEWTEGDSARSRKVIMASTVSIFLIVSFLIFVIPIIFQSIVLPDMFSSMYGYLCGVMGTVYGFFTATKSNNLLKENIENKINRFRDKIKDTTNTIENNNNNKKEKEYYDNYYN